jgi:hypothetical protein
MSNNAITLNNTNQNQDFDISIFEIQDGKINLTKMARHFGKEVKEWSKLPTAKNFLKALEKSEGGKSPITTFKGNNGKEQGTFGIREVALKLAQWISPEFEVFCIKKLDELFQTGKTELKPSQSSQLDFLQGILDSLKAHENRVTNLETRVEKVENESRSITISTAKEYKTIVAEKTMSDYRRPIANLIHRKYENLLPQFRYNQAYFDYSKKNGKTIPSVTKASSEQLQDFLAWLERTSLK